jgi:hypothetical protein
MWPMVSAVSDPPMPASAAAITSPGKPDPEPTSAIREAEASSAT